MSISITINDINNLTDTERAVLRLVADNSVATSLQRTVRALHNAPLEATVTKDVATIPTPPPKEPDEVWSPHTIVQTMEATVPTVPASAELDSKGLPWDKRIHSSSRAKVADGSWRKVRGVDDALVAQVEAELRAVQVAPQVESAPKDGEDVVTAPVPVPPVPVAAVPLPPAPMTFATMMQRITPSIVSGALSQARIQEVCAQLQLPHLAALGARPDLIPAALAALEGV